MTRLVSLVFCCSVLAFASEDAAQDDTPDTVYDGRVWFIGTVQDRFTPTSPWRWSFETLLRSRDGLSDVDSFGLRPIVNYAITSRSTVGGGYGWAPTFPASGRLDEHRFFQQYIWAGPLSGGTLTMRSRLEQRIMDGNSGTLANRFRQQVRFNHALHKGSRISLIGYDEVFFHLNDTTRTPRGVDQNRIFGGMGFAFNPRTRLELGYLNQFLPGHNRAPARMNHVLSSAFVVSLH
jgi:hypothetical protein